MTVIALIILGQTASPKAILDRYAAYRKANPAISVEWSMMRAHQDPIHGTLLIDSNKRMLFKAFLGTESYSCSETELGGIELSPAEMVYDEFPAQPALVAPISRISPASSFLPGALMRSQLYAPKVKYRSEGSVKIQNTQADVVSWVVTQMGSSSKYTVAIDSAGRLLHLTRETTEQGAGSPKMPMQKSGMGQKPPTKFEWNISNYQPHPNAPLSAFLTPLPKGFVPYSLPPASDVQIAVDGRFPSVIWNDGGKLVDFKATGKPLLMLITAPDCAPSQLVLSDINKLKSGITGSALTVVSLARTRSAAHGLPYDFSGKASTTLGATSTPLFVLVDPTGKVANLWSGYAPAAEPALVKEIQAAVAAITTK